MENGVAGHRGLKASLIRSPAAKSAFEWQAGLAFQNVKFY